jgi:uncharacterized protein YdhG (YjbR/CyaY superfamily)
MPKWATVDAYLASLPDERRERLTAMRAMVVAAAPGADEVIAYDMPALRLDGQFLISFASYKHHDSLFPASDGVETELADEVRPYRAGKGTIRFPASEPLPLDLIRRIVEIRVREHVAPRGPSPSRTSST